MAPPADILKPCIDFASEISTTEKVYHLVLQMVIKRCYECKWPPKGRPINKKLIIDQFKHAMHYIIELGGPDFMGVASSLLYLGAKDF